MEADPYQGLHDETHCRKTVDFPYECNCEGSRDHRYERNHGDWPIDMNAIVKARKNLLSVLTCKVITHTFEFYMRSNNMTWRAVAIPSSFRARYEHAVWKLNLARCNRWIIHCLSIVHCPLSVVHCSLSIIHCSSFVVQSLFNVHWSLFNPNRFDYMNISKIHFHSTISYYQW